MHRTRRALLASLLTAATVAVGFALAAIPNVELMTTMVFISGYLLGAGLGLIVGVCAITLHSVFNPLGAALPPLLLAQMIGFSTIGVAGAITGRFIADIERRWLAAGVAGVVGFALTLLYDVLTNVGAFFTFAGERSTAALVTFVAAGLAFMGTTHLIVNTGLFIVCLKPILNVLARYRRELA